LAARETPRPSRRPGRGTPGTRCPRRCRAVELSE
jgi:hypothetical protein